LIELIKLDAGVMEAITVDPTFGDRNLKIPRKTVTCICPIVVNPRSHNSETIGVTMMKCELDV
jgi:hypothetical protein